MVWKTSNSRSESQVTDRGFKRTLAQQKPTWNLMRHGSSHLYSCQKTSWKKIVNHLSKSNSAWNFLWMFYSIPLGEPSVHLPQFHPKPVSATLVVLGFDPNSSCCWRAHPNGLIVKHQLVTTSRILKQLDILPKNRLMKIRTHGCFCRNTSFKPGLDGLKRWFGLDLFDSPKNLGNLWNKSLTWMIRPFWGSDSLTCHYLLGWLLGRLVAINCLEKWFLILTGPLPTRRLLNPTGWNWMALWPPVTGVCVEQRLGFPCFASPML